MSRSSGRRSTPSSSSTRLGYRAGGIDPPLFEEAAEALSSRVNFGEVNTDEFIRVKSIPIANVPTVAYYKDGQLIAALVGAQQDVTARTQAMLDGKRIGRKDGWG